MGEQNSSVIGRENQDLKNDLKLYSDQVDVLNSKIISMATEISQKEDEIKNLKKQNEKEVEEPTTSSQENKKPEDLQETGSALHEEIKTLRKHLNETKNEVEELHKEKENYSSLS